MKAFCWLQLALTACVLPLPAHAVTNGYITAVLQSDCASVTSPPPVGQIAIGPGYVMKTVGKGAMPENNVRSFFWTLEAGIRPIPNQIIGFPIEDFEAIYQNMDAWKRLGIVVKPFYATPYPGSEWFTVYRDWIMKQYDGDLEKYILDLGDATRITAVISHNFNAVELLGLRELMINFDYKRIREYEQYWRAAHEIPEGKPSTLYDPHKGKTRAKVVATPIRVLARVS